MQGVTGTVAIIAAYRQRARPAMPRRIRISAGWEGTAKPATRLLYGSRPCRSTTDRRGTHLSEPIGRRAAFLVILASAGPARQLNALPVTPETMSTMGRAGLIAPLVMHRQAGRRHPSITTGIPAFHLLADTPQPAAHLATALAIRSEGRRALVLHAM